jgi:hypothetical protein
LMECRGPIGLAELREIIFVSDEGLEEKVSGVDLIHVLKINRGACLLPHDQYFAFIKELRPAFFTLHLPVSLSSRTYKSLKLCLVYNTDPAVIGTRLLQSRPLGSDYEQRLLIKHLEKKVSSLVTLRGFIWHQLEWLGSVIFKSKKG